jgi:hypothetical protein
VCAENVVRFDLVRESVNDGREGRAERRSLEHVRMVMVWQCQTPQCRSLSVGLAPIAGSLPFGDCNPPAGDNHPLASPGVGAYSRSGNRVGRPRISAELRKLIGEMSRANHLSGAPCVYRKLDSAIVVMQSAQQRMRCDASDPLNRAREGRVLFQRSVRSHIIVIARIRLQNPA